MQSGYLSSASSLRTSGSFPDEPERIHRTRSAPLILVPTTHNTPSLKVHILACHLANDYSPLPKAIPRNGQHSLNPAQTGSSRRERSPRSALVQSSMHHGGADSEEGFLATVDAAPRLTARASATKLQRTSRACSTRSTSDMSATRRENRNHKFIHDLRAVCPRTC